MQEISKFTEQKYRNLVVKFDSIAMELGEIAPKEFNGDVSAIFMHIRYSCHLLRDIRSMIDMRENPQKMIAEFTPKKQSEVEGVKDVSR